MRVIPEITSPEDWAKFKAEGQSKAGCLLLKHSTSCGISTAAKEEFDAWLETSAPENIVIAWINVISSRGLSRDIADEVGVRHQSPQVILFSPELKVVWDASHFKITQAELASKVQG